jgi:DNA-nicking Smr family endonuclease
MPPKPPGRPDRALTDDEAALWADVMRDTQALDPAARRRSAEAAPVPEAVRPPDDPAPREMTKPNTPPPPPGRGATPPPTGGTGTDRRTQVRLRRGQLEIDARIDLHGHTQPQARASLETFLASSAARGHRCVLVITGKGSPRGGDEAGFMPDRERGVLREQVPRWLSLAPLAHHVVTWQPAARQHGGGGALYILVRRKK